MGMRSDAAAALPPPRDASASPTRSTSARYASCWNCALVKKVSRLVSRTPAQTWSWIKPRSGLPSVGTVYC